MENIQNDVFAIIKDKLKIDLNGKESDLSEKNIFSNEINVTPINLIYLMVLIEKKYGIRFTEEDFDSSDFYTIKGMSSIIMAHINA